MGVDSTFENSSFWDCPPPIKMVSKGYPSRIDYLQFAVGYTTSDFEKRYFNVQSLFAHRNLKIRNNDEQTANCLISIVYICTISKLPSGSTVIANFLLLSLKVLCVPL